MAEDFPLIEVSPSQKKHVPSASQISHGNPIPPVQLLQIFSPDDWESFIEEWLSYWQSEGEYDSIRRFSGPGDLGLDVIAFAGKEGFSELWDSFQCKHYSHALRPEDVSLEVAKLIYHSFMQTPPFNQKYGVPRKHIFVSPNGSGLTVKKWFKDPERFKNQTRQRWLQKGMPDIGQGVHVKLEGEFLTYFDNFDFSIFDDKSAVELVKEHSQTQFYAARFGGGLPPRDPAPSPPAEPTEKESLYLGKLFEAYTEHLGANVDSREHLIPYTELLQNYDRQRTLFYSAEALRNFARDRTPDGTFASLKEDIYHAVIDICEQNHESGLSRLRSAISTAAKIDISGNALVGVTAVADKQGVCHHLANDDRLRWVKKDD